MFKNPFRTWEALTERNRGIRMGFSRMTAGGSGRESQLLARDPPTPITGRRERPAVTPPQPPPPDLSTELYYCKHCSYSNRSVVGVLVHYQKRHPEIKVTAKYIRQAPPTAAMMRGAEGPQGSPRPPGDVRGSSFPETPTLPPTG